MGLPLLLTAYGPDGALPTIVVALIFTLFISGVIAVLEATEASGPSAFRVAAQLTGTLLRNPVVVSPVLGIIYSMTAQWTSWLLWLAQDSHSLIEPGCKRR